MADTPEIINFKEVVEPHLNGGKLVSYTSRYLTRAGENYGSVMLAVMANIERPSGEMEELALVAKLPPVTNELFWDIFQPERTCITENAVYKFLSPAIRSLQIEAGVKEAELFDGFTRYYGSRISLDKAATKVDRDAVLVQENVQTAGFKAGNRHKMFDLVHAKLVIEQMAQFHALPIALRLKRPQEYERNIRPYFGRFNINNGVNKDMKAKMENELLKEIVLATNNNEDCVERVKELLKMYDDFAARTDYPDGPFTTIVHSDMWINNLMLLYDENDVPIKVKFVDFQIAQSESLVHDVIFFLVSSVETQVLDENFDKLLSLYYRTFIRCLSSVGVATDHYSFESFLDEVQRCGPIEVLHALMMTKVILADTNTMPDDYKDLDMSVLNKNFGLKKISERMSDIIRLAKKYKIF